MATCHNYRIRVIAFQKRATKKVDDTCLRLWRRYTKCALRQKLHSVSCRFCLFASSIFPARKKRKVGESCCFWMFQFVMFHRCMRSIKTLNINPNQNKRSYTENENHAVKRKNWRKIVKHFFLSRAKILKAQNKFQKKNSGCILSDWPNV